MQTQAAQCTCAPGCSSRQAHCGYAKPPMRALLDRQTESTERAAVASCSPLRWHLLVQPLSHEARTEIIGVCNQYRWSHLGGQSPIMPDSCCLTMLHQYAAAGLALVTVWAAGAAGACRHRCNHVPTSQKEPPTAVGAHRFLCPPRLGGRGFPS